MSSSPPDRPVPEEPALSASDVDRFVRDGAVRLRSAFSRPLAEACRQLLWAATGCDERDRTTWTRPVVRIARLADPPFVEAVNTDRLRTALDQLAGPRRWVPRRGVGTFPIRFPSDKPPGDDGWHIESTGSGPDGAPVVDPASCERVIFLLMLFSDVGPRDAPTRLRLGSHLAGARAVFASGEPVGFHAVARELEGQSAHLPEALATGRAGDVWLCHPFVLHAAQANRRGSVRFVGQPPVGGVGPIEPARPAAERSPVEEAVHRALAV